MLHSIQSTHVKNKVTIKHHRIKWIFKMLDIQLLRKDTTAVAERLKTRGLRFDVDGVNALAAQRKASEMRTEQGKSQPNNV